MVQADTPVPINSCSVPLYSSIINDVISLLPSALSYCSSHFPLMASTTTTTIYASPSTATQTLLVSYTPTSTQTIIVTQSTTEVEATETITAATYTITGTSFVASTQTVTGSTVTITVCPNVAAPGKLKRNPLWGKRLEARTVVTTTRPPTCNADNCYRALVGYQRTAVPTYCAAYLRSTTLSAPKNVATYEPSRISSACRCLTTGQTTTSTSSSFTTTSSSTSTRSTSLPPLDAALCSCIEKAPISTVVQTVTPTTTVTIDSLVTAMDTTSTVLSTITLISSSTPINSVDATEFATVTSYVATTTSTTATVTMTAAAGGVYTELEPTGGACGCGFDIYCGYSADFMNVERFLTTADYQACVDACDSQLNCAYAVFDITSNTCKISTSYQGQAVSRATTVLIIKHSLDGCAHSGAAGCMNQ